MLFLYHLVVYDISESRMTIRAFSLLLFGLRFTVINECEDEISVLQLCWRTFQLAGAAGLLLVSQLPGVTGPADKVEEHRQVGEGRRQQRLRVKELDRQAEPSVPADRDHQVSYLSMWYNGKYCRASSDFIVKSFYFLFS